MAVAALLTTSGVSQALTVSSGSVSFTGSASVSANAHNALTATITNNGASVANVAMGQFNAATGVLTGADIQLSSSRTQTIDGSGYKNNGAPKTASGSGTANAALNASGVSATFSTLTQAGGSCNLAGGPTGNITCGWAPVTSSAEATNTTASVNDTNLNDYVGDSTVNAALSLPSLSATSTITNLAGPNNKGSTTNYSVQWEGDLQVNYSYLLHADASFDASASQNSLTLNFGTVLQNSAAPTLDFSIFNLADINRTGLDLDGFSGSGDTGIFNTGLVGFADLAQGGSNGFIASMLTDTLGGFTASYLLELSDADFGASSTRQNQTLTLNLVGEVVPVPVPATIWLFGSALVGLMGVSRRKQPV